MGWLTDAISSLGGPDRTDNEFRSVDLSPDQMYQAGYSGFRGGFGPDYSTLAAQPAPGTPGGAQLQMGAGGTLRDRMYASGMSAPGTGINGGYYGGAQRTSGGGFIGDLADQARQRAAGGPINYGGFAGELGEEARQKGLAAQNGGVVPGAGGGTPAPRPGIIGQQLGGGGQFGLFSRLEAQSMGLGPSLADQQMRIAGDRGLAQLQALSAGNRRNPALAARTAMLQGGQMNAQLAGQSALARIQEQREAQGLLASGLQQAREQDELMSRYNADVRNQAILERERLRGQRFNGITGTPTSFERGAGVLGAVGGTAVGFIPNPNRQR